MYAIWHACERFRLLPPDVKPQFEDNTAAIQAMLIAYDQIREYEDAKKWPL
jgi:hypothetical protein